MFILRLILLPFRLALTIVGSTVRIGFRLGALPARIGFRAGRLMGVRGWLFLVVGVLIGLVAAPMTGRDLRRKLQAYLGSPDSGTSLADKVAFELAHAPRTWHLTQPEVSVRGDEVVLQGVVADDDARDELGRVASAIPGVTRVDNRLDVADATAQP